MQEEPYVEVHDSGHVRQMPIGLDPLTVGRHRDNRLVLGDSMASRFHCLISKSKKGYLLRDLNSSNGTLLNGKETKLTRLINGDEVRIGQAKLIFRAPNGEAEGPRDNSDLMDEIRRQSKTVPLGFEPVPDMSIPDPPKTVVRPPVNRPAVREHIGLDSLGLSPSHMPAPEDDLSYEVDLDAIPDRLNVPEEEVAESLTDDMIIEDDEGAIPLEEPAGGNGSPPPSYAQSSYSPIPMDEGPGADQPDLLDDVASAASARDPEAEVERMVNSLPDRTFGETDIALVGARGNLVHAMGAGAGRTGRREAVDWLRLLLLLCARGRATDIHLEPKGQDYVIRVRIDAAMVEVCRVSNTMGLKMSALVKVLSEIDMTQKSTIQEGHFSSRVPTGRRGERRIDYRISFAPSVFGQKMVVRVLDASYAPLSVGALQMPDWMRQETERVIQQDSGMCLVCGPTGSGKTTSLYALIRGSDVSRRNVVTIEDPVEIQLEGVTQIPVDEEQGKTFSNLLRSTLRQDPDVILIGEIRDAETARTSMQAAITGHLVFSTLHTQNTIGTVFRLLDLGAEPYLIAQALQLIIAQRLVKQLCPSCKFSVKPSQEQLQRMGEFGRGLTHIYAPRGCGRCLGTGFFGRRAIFELLSVNDELRDLISSGAPASKMQAAVTKGRFQRLHESGFQLVAQGAVPYEEIDRAVGRER